MPIVSELCYAIGHWMGNPKHTDGWGWGTKVDECCTIGLLCYKHPEVAPEPILWKITHLFLFKTTKPAHKVIMNVYCCSLRDFIIISDTDNFVQIMLPQYTGK